MEGRQKFCQEALSQNFLQSAENKGVLTALIWQSITRKIDILNTEHFPRELYSHKSRPRSESHPSLSD
jgi:hypothetical protein